MLKIQRLSLETAEDSDVDEEGKFDADSKEGGVCGCQTVGCAVVAPTNAPEDDPTAPDTSLELDFVHGYRSQDVRNNLYYTSTGEIAYFAASVGIIYSKKLHSQNFYTGHSDDIVCMAMHPEGKYVATGQVGKMPMVHVWNAMTGQLVKKLRPFHRVAVSSLAFSSDGSSR